MRRMRSEGLVRLHCSVVLLYVAIWKATAALDSRDQRKRYDTWSSCLRHPPGEDERTKYMHE